MNTNHYPDIERCKKLTEIGFPVCQLAWCDMTGRDAPTWRPEDIRLWDGEISARRRQLFTYAQCPSVMEMLDVIDLHLIITKKDNHAMVTVEIPGDKPHHFVDTLPNALADLIFWLHENKYLTF